MTTDQNNAAQVAEQDPLSDEYVNAVIRQHGYGHPTAVAARLWQWIGLHGGENGLTLLIYEAHKALSKLRASVADEESPPTAPDDDAIAECWVNASDSDGIAYDGPSFERGYRAALASAPVAGEAQPVAWRALWTLPTPGATAWHDTRKVAPPDEAEMRAKGYSLELAFAAPQASAEPLARYCPGCGSVGPVGDEYRDCCPDGNQARMIPARLAEKCRDTFRLAIQPLLPDASANDGAAPQASEAVRVIGVDLGEDGIAMVRNQALEEAGHALVRMRVVVGEVDAIVRAVALIRALKTQADKDGTGSKEHQ